MSTRITTLGSLKGVEGSFFVFIKAFTTEGILKQKGELVFISKTNHPSQPGLCYLFKKSPNDLFNDESSSCMSFTDSFNHYRGMSAGKIVYGTTEMDGYSANTRK